MRRTSLTVLLLTLVATPLVPSPAPAVAQVETCQGQPVTIVSTFGEDITEGTEGDDVILVGPSGAYEILGFGGDDLICLSGSGVMRLVEGGDGHDSVDGRFSGGHDSITLNDVEDVDLEMGGGFDHVILDRPHGVGSIDGGGGSAALLISGKELDLDLKTGDLNVDNGDGLYSVSRVHRVLAVARRVQLTGNGKDNGLRVRGCDMTVRGGGGDDVVKISSGDFRACPRKARVLGQKGDDRMTGYDGDDVLIGGPGFDKADGWLGTDRCEAEKEVGCER